MMQVPRALSSAILLKSLSTSRSVMAEVGSSMMIMLASMEIAFSISSIWMSDTVKSFIRMVGW